MIKRLSLRLLLPSGSRVAVIFASKQRDKFDRDVKKCGQNNNSDYMKSLRFHYVYYSQKKKSLVGSFAASIVVMYSQYEFIMTLSFSASLPDCCVLFSWYVWVCIVWFFESSKKPGQLFSLYSLKSCTKSYILLLIWTLFFCVALFGICYFPSSFRSYFQAHIPTTPMTTKMNTQTHFIGWIYIRFGGKICFFPKPKQNHSVVLGIGIFTHKLASPYKIPMLRSI